MNSAVVEKRHSASINSRRIPQVSGHWFGLAIWILLPISGYSQIEFTAPTWKQLNASSTRVLSQEQPESNLDRSQSQPESRTTNSTMMEREPSTPRPIVTRQARFGIPFSIGANSEPVREVQLHVSNDQGKSWSLYGRQEPTAREFPFQATADGTYFFAVQTVGSRIPTRELKPELVITVDSQRPVMNVGLKTDALGRIVVNWRATDPNLVPDSVKIAYQSVPGWGRAAPNWTPVQLPKPDSSVQTVYQDEVAFYPQTNNVSVNLRIAIDDRAGNTTLVFRRINLPRTALIRRDPKMAYNQASRTTTGAPNRMATAEKGSRPPGTDPYSKFTQSDKDAAAERIGRGNRFDTVGASRSTSGTESTRTESNDIREGWKVVGGNAGFRQDFAGNSPNEADYVEPNKSGDSVDDFESSDPNFRKPSFGGSSFASSSQSSNLEEQFHQGENLNRIPDGQYAKLSRSRRFELDYLVDQIEPDDISKLEVWVTEDAGASWNLQTTDSDRQSPVLIDVKDDGVYGFRIRVKTIDGLESSQPVKGDPADVWVEVDTTKPGVELTSLPFGRRRDAGKLIINWRATDKRLAAKPITLYYSVNIDGPWQILVEKLPNSGQFKWPVTNRIPKKVYLRIEAIDAAGNRNIHQTSQPVDLSGLNPRGMIRSVRPIE